MVAKMRDLLRIRWICELFVKMRDYRENDLLDVKMRDYRENDLLDVKMRESLIDVWALEIRVKCLPKGWRCEI